jgi:pimeloyl-ACP methyl ester carboxylesterase
MTEITPFRIHVPDHELDLLAARLDHARWPDPLPGAGWAYGVEAGYLADLAHHWRHGYDWRAHETRLNALPQFRTLIDGQAVHFVHAPSPQPGALPLLLLHGWPTSFAAYAPVVAPLCDPHAEGAADAPAFDVVVPSLPGFGFSGPTRERGWGVRRNARAMVELMRRLGYDRFIVQGGDWGSIIASEAARIAPEAVIGIHLNAAVSLSVVDWTSDDPTAGLTDEEVARLQAFESEWEERSGYAVVQSTRPHTLAYALTDSPLGLLAWNLEWFVDYDPARAEQTPIDRDDILTEVTIYWVTRTAASAARIYREGSDGFYGGDRTDHPAAVAVFPGDAPIRSLAEQQLSVVRWTEYDRGGHFASLQAPDLLVADLRAFSEDLRAAGADRSAR